MNAEILHIEDDEVVVESLRRGMQKHRTSSSVHHVHDGVEALEWLRSLGGGPLPSLIVLDLSLPRMSGQRFLAELRADSKLRACVVFVLTTSAQSRDVEASFVHNVAGYFQKSAMGRNYESFAEVAALHLARGTFCGVSAAGPS